MMKKFRSIFISDVHLGALDCKAKHLESFLRNNTCECLYLVGDIIDGWKLTQNKWRWCAEQSSVIERILRIAHEDTRVIYIPGNHDEFLRSVLDLNLTFHNIELHDSFCHTGVDGKRYLVIHGDLFDGITSVHRWLAIFGENAYDLVLRLNTRVNQIRHLFGFDNLPITSYVKRKVKTAMSFIFRFEENVTSYAKLKSYDGVICGHIHYPELKMINDIHYMNDGDWVESCTAIVETHDGNFEILYWLKQKQ